jgi:hypothetical protein
MMFDPENIERIPWDAVDGAADTGGDFVRASTYDQLLKLYRSKKDQDKPASGELIVAITENGKEIVINHPDLKPDAEGVGHIVFSPEQAVHLAVLLWKKANIIRGLVCGHCGDQITQEGGWAVAQFHYCFKDECQQEFYKEAQEMIRKVDPETADRLAEAVKVNHHVVVASASMKVFGEIYRTHFPQSGRPFTDKASLPMSFTCPKCNAVSYNPNDVRERYCGACHEFSQ